MLRELETVDIKLKVLSFIALIVNPLAKGELVPVVGEVVGHLEHICESGCLPAHLGLAANVQGYVATTHVVLD